MTPPKLNFQSIPIPYHQKFKKIIFKMQNFESDLFLKKHFLATIWHIFSDNNFPANFRWKFPIFLQSCFSRIRARGCPEMGFRYMRCVRTPFQTNLCSKKNMRHHAHGRENFIDCKILRNQSSTWRVICIRLY